MAHILPPTAPPTALPPPLFQLSTDNLLHLHCLLDVPSVFALQCASKTLMGFLGEREVVWRMLCERDLGWPRPLLQAVMEALKIPAQRITEMYRCFFRQKRPSELLGIYRDLSNPPRGGWLRIHQRRDDGKVCLTMLVCPGPRERNNTRPVLTTSVLEYNDDGDRDSFPFLLLTPLGSVPVCLESTVEGHLLLTSSPLSSPSDTPRVFASRHVFGKLCTDQAAGGPPAPPRHLELAKTFHRRLFTGVYGPHGQEVLHTEVLHTEEFGWVLRGLKVTGDRNVPCGEDSVRAHLNEECDVLHEAAFLPDQHFSVFGKAPNETALPTEIGLVFVSLRDDRLPYIAKWYKGFGQINMVPGIWEPQQVAVHLLVYRQRPDGLAFSIMWVDDFHVLDFYHYFGGAARKEEEELYYDFDWMTSKTA